MCCVQLYMSRETELKKEVVLLRQEKQELQYNICLLEEDNQTLRDEAQHLRGKMINHSVLSWFLQVHCSEFGGSGVLLKGLPLS